MKFFLFWTLLGCASLAGAAELPRVAIVAEASAKTEADLLTVELSHQPVVLLERTEIERVLAEQRLSVAALAGKPLLQLGAVLGADGVLFLGTARVAGKEVLTSRLVAVHPGVIAGAWPDPAPLPDPAAWSRKTAAAITELLPKLKVAREAAIPISVVNLRATRARPEAATLESEMALLLIHRLAHEPAFFVLERQQMDALVSEQREEPAAFWTGRYLVDGAIEQSLTDPDQLTLRLRLQPPGGQAVIPIMHACRRDGLPAAADFLTREIARLLKREPVAAKWDAPREAEQFWRDAQWAFGNQLFARAATAAESSAALGRRDAETLTLRIRAELLAARPELVLPYAYPKNQQYLSGYLTERNWTWRAQMAHTRGYRSQDVLARVYQEMPEAERESRLARTQRAMELWRDHAAELLAERGQIPLATDLLTIGGAMLEWFRDNRPGWGDDLERLAARLREVDDLATSRVQEFSTPPRQKPPALFWQSKVALTPLWAADPARTLATFRAALAEPFDAGTAAAIRITIVHSRDLVPELTAGGDHRQSAAPWAKFVEELLGSDSLANRWTGLCLQYETAPKEAQEAIAVRSRDAYWAERARFAQHELPYAYFELLRLPRGDHAAIVSGRIPYTESPSSAFPRQFLLYLLAESTPIDREFFHELFHPDFYSEAQAAKMLAAIRAHEARVRAKLGDHWVLGMIRESSQNLLTRFPQLRTETPLAGDLKITRYWTPYRLPQFRDGTLQAANLYIQDMIYRQGRLWVFADFQGPERGRDAKKPMFIFGVDLKTFETEVIPFEEPPPLAAPRKDHWQGANLEISPDAVFVSREWQLSRYDRKAKTWRHFTGMPGVWAQPWLIGGRLYVRTNNTPGFFQTGRFGELLQVDPQTGVPTLLASDRRNPAESPLESWGSTSLTVRAGTAGRVFFRGTASDGSRKLHYAAYDPAAKRWEPLDESAWRPPEPGTGSPAHMAMAGGETAWKVEGLKAGRDTPSLVNGAQRFPFHCALSAEDRTLLALNGPSLTMEAIEQNRRPPFPSSLLGCETPEGFALSGVFWMPGFWFVPKAELERAAAEPPSKP